MVLKSLLPGTDGDIRGIWNQEMITTLMAVFELRRVELHSDVDKAMDNGCDTIARVIHELATRTYFTDHRSPNLLVDLEIHLRLLASAIRVYKYCGRCLDRQIHQDVHQGLETLANTLTVNRRGTDERLRVEESNSAFLLKHCQYLLLSIDNSGALGRTVARRAVMKLEDSVEMDQAYLGGSRFGLEILHRQRLRPRWHDEYQHLEDTCWSIFAGDIHGLRGRGRDVDTILEETNAAMQLLQDSMKALPTPLAQSQRTARKLRHVVQVAKKATDEEYYDENDNLRYGILDLLHQLSFRTRKRSRVRCFAEYVHLLRMILEQSPSTVLRTKATDLWNRILDLGEKDGIGYGHEDDRQAIHCWISRHHEESERLEYSAAYPVPCMK
jgi:hypothetical protein